MKEYDSILKEKKVYKDPVTHHSKYTKYVVIYIILLIILLLISYIIYYQKILSPSNIFLNDTNILLEKYSTISSKLLPENLENIQNLEGTLQLNDSNYNYNILLNERNPKIELSNQDTILFYQQNNQKQYIKISSFQENIIQLNEQINIMFNNQIKDKTKKYLTDEKYIKKLYLDGKTPVVETNLLLTNQDIYNILGINLSNDTYEIMITLKNHALKNTFLTGKMVINNKSKNTRMVFNYANDSLEYIDNDGKKYKISILTNNEDFTLRIYQEEELYSILLGKKLEKTYQYTYQIIDKVYNIQVDFTKEKEKYQYDFISNIEKDGVEIKQTAKLTLQINTNKKTENQINSSQIIFYQNLSKDEKKQYKESINKFFSPLRNFIKQHQT